MPDSPLLAGWTNGNLYAQTTESFDILPIPADVIKRFNFLPHEVGGHFNQVVVALAGSKPSKPQSFRHGFLASKQGTHFSVLHVHTQSERQLFSDLLGKPLVSSAGTGKWKMMADLWGEFVNGYKIFYKARQCFSDHFHFSYSKFRDHSCLNIY